MFNPQVKHANVQIKKIDKKDAWVYKYIDPSESKVAHGYIFTVRGIPEAKEEALTTIRGKLPNASIVGDEEFNLLAELHSNEFLKSKNENLLAIEGFIQKIVDGDEIENYTLRVYENAPMPLDNMFAYYLADGGGGNSCKIIIPVPETELKVEINPCEFGKNAKVNRNDLLRALSSLRDELLKKVTGTFRTRTPERVEENVYITLSEIPDKVGFYPVS